MRPIFGAAFALLLAISPVIADDLRPLADACFARTYDTAHLAKHPRQKVTAISVEFIEFEDSVVARLGFTLREFAGDFGYSGDCYRDIKGGASCEGCAGDSCESNGESFKILLKGSDSIEVVNDTTGLTLADAADLPATVRLAADEEHKVFSLTRVDRSVCDE